MTDAFIDAHFDEIKSHDSDIEKRMYDAGYTPDSLKADNHHYMEAFIRSGEQVTLIDADYEETMKTLLDTKIKQTRIN